ncbi:hypothetical protein D9758_017094 [Tetrapyrgos nigripes]|uniref:Uncharacterized protein n=1 Tax=Tetrapyrgos nigripes TaxID=182062 RepID=A0A8H5FF70_9AGAR|nr:hypothetical protein D9758_017094 [Tetrapyrgos nigripes]
MDPFFSSPFPRTETTKPNTIRLLESWNGSSPDSRFRFKIVHLSDEPIADDEAKWAQVLKGRIRHQNNDEVVVMKIFQESKFPSSEYSGPELAWKEAHAYGEMKLLQGDTIPRSFGFHKIYMTSVNGKQEPYFAHILEFKDLPTLTSIERFEQSGQEELSKDAIFSLARLRLLALYMPVLLV